jgi:ankyrin repeat protein
LNKYLTPLKKEVLKMSIKMPLLGAWQYTIALLFVTGCCPMISTQTRSSKLDPAAYFHSAIEQQICQSIADRDVDSLQRLIQEIPDVNVVGESGMTFLFWAWVEDNFEAYKVLLAAGACPDTKLEQTIVSGIQVFAKGDSVLFASLSAQRGEDFLNAGLANTKDPNQVDLGGNGLLQRLYAMGSSSARFRSLPQIIAAGVDLDRVGPEGVSALEAALRSREYTGDLGCITLLEAGANPVCNGRKLYDQVCDEIRSSNEADTRLVDIKTWLEEHNRN